MNSLALVLVAAIGVFCPTEGFHLKPKTSNDTLVMSNVLFRHGHRAPDEGSIFTNSLYRDESFYLPHGFGQLTNKGKLREFKIGTALRKRYEPFLGEYYIKKIEARSDDYNRTKMSLLAVLAGLFPPGEELQWSGLNWQPIPISYLPLSEDKELFPEGACSNYAKYKEENDNTPEAEQYYNDNKELFEYVSYNTGDSFTTAGDLYNLYLTFETQNGLNLSLEDWTKEIYPEPLKTMAPDYFNQLRQSTRLLQTMSGYLLKKIISDVQAKINGTLTPKERVLYLYSAHDTNVGPLLSVLGFTLKASPDFGSYVIIEVHKINGKYGVKILHQNYDKGSEDPQLLTLPGCEEFCILDKFISLVSKYLPEDDTVCGN